MNQPLVSTVLAVYNERQTVVRALDSIAAQSYPNIEVIGVDDGSTDATLAVMKGWQRSHPAIPLTILQNGQNRGLAASLNRGIAAARGTFIARIDADDQWQPTKIAKQVAFLVTHPDHGVIGSWYINERESQEYLIKLPVDDTTIKQRMFRKNPFGHSCVIMRKEVVEQVGGYNGQLREDRDLWFRLLRRTHFHNLPEFLVRRNISRSHFTSPRELKRNIRTVHTYIQHYQVSPLTYLWLLEPVAVYMYHTLKRYVAP